MRGLARRSIARFVVSFTAVALFAALRSAPAHAEIVGREIADADPAAASLLARIEAREPNVRIEVLGSSAIVHPVTGHAYTLLKARIGQRDVIAVLNEATGTFALDGALPEREAQEVLARLPKVYRKMSAEILGIVRQAEGGSLGRGVERKGSIAIVFHADSPEGLDAIEAELGDLPAERFDAVALWKAAPPVMAPLEDGTVPPPPPAPRIFTVTAEVPFAELLRIGSLDAVARIEPEAIMTPRLDVSVPRIHGDTTRGFGLEGLSADIGVVDTGIDDTHPNLPYVTAEMDFTAAGMVCDGGSRRKACQSNCAGGACSTRTRRCVGGPANGMTCCPGGVCETAVGDTDGHGTHVAGIAGNDSAGLRGMAHLADLINAKAIPGANAPAALAFARGAGADVINGSYGATSRGCRGFCTAPPASVGAVCGDDADCDAPVGAGNGLCGAPLGNPCIVNATCDLPAGAGNGMCTSAVNTGQSGSTRAVDFEVFSSNVTVAIAAEERPFNGRCSNAAATPCWGDAACPAGGACLAYPSSPNDTFNGITVGSTSVTPGASTVSSFSQRGPTQDVRSKPDVVAPGEAPPSGQCVGGGNNGNPCSDVLGDTDCPAGNCSPGTCVGLCTAPAFLIGLSCSANADCDTAVGMGNGACALGANFGGACTDTRNSPECPGGLCRFTADADGIDSCAANWEGIGVGRCSAPAARAGVLCFVGADCDSPVAAGNGVCGTIPGIPAPGAANPDFVDLEGTSMAAPHVAGLAAQLWDFANLRGLIKDTPHLKVTILNTANRLAGWTRPSITQPLDIAQGTGEVDALEAFHAFADDLRVWQQSITGTAPKDSHWYWTDLTAGSPVTLTLVFERHETNLAAAAVTPLNDLDLRLYDPSGTAIERSVSLVDSVEHIVYTPTVTGRYCVEVDPFTLPPGAAELYAVAGTPQRLNFTGTVNPCRLDFGDAPDPFTAPAFYPTLLASNGARHYDWTKEWLGTSRPEIDGELEKGTLAVLSRVDPFPSVSGEVDAVDPADEDGMPNLVDRDGWDDGVVIPGPFLPGVAKVIKITVQTTVDDTGVGPTGRYDAAVPTKRLYLNGWADWDGNGDWGGAAEKIVGTGSPTGQVAVDPATFGTNARFTIGEAFTDVNGSGRWEPSEPFTDAVGKTERTFSFVVVPPLAIAPDFYLRFRVDYGEDVGIVANTSGNLVQYRGQAGFGEVEDYNNRYEYDVFTQSLATVDVRFPADSTTEHLVVLSGPSTVRVDLATVSDTDGDGREQVPTLMVQLELSGTDPTLGPIVVRRRDPSVHPFQTSTGEIEESVNTVSGTLDLEPFVTSPPGLCADSYFNVFFEVELVGSGVTLHNHRPKRMSGMIYGKPPREGDTYSNPDFTPLYDAGENLVALIGPGFHTPNPRPRKGEVDIFAKTLAQMDLRMPPGGDANLVDLSGPATVVVDLGGIADTDSDTLEQVTTEMTKLDLRGVDQPFGPLIVRTRSASLHPFQRSTGEIEENASLTPRVLDLPPFVTSPPGLDASSYFNIFVEVELPNLGLRLHTHAPKFMSSTIHNKPPAPGDVYQSPDFIPLFDEAENIVAEIGPGLHVPTPSTGTCCLSLGGSSCATTMSTAQCEGLGGRFIGDAACAACTVSTAPPGVPNTLQVQKLDPSGANLLVFWSGSSCPAVDYELLFGTHFPSSYLGTYSLAGGVCTTGGGQAMTWITPPSTSQLLWFVVAAHDGAGTEGPWGRNTGGVDRTGSGPGGSSQVCSDGKTLVNLCGQSECTASGLACSLPATCCTGICAGGLCCGPDGSTCVSGGECCSGTCTSGACETPCGTIGEACTLNSQCCSGNCGAGTCQLPCSPNGQTCSSSGECCSGNCLEGTCAAPCASNGAACSAPGECCSSVCLAGQCCGQDGDMCGSSGECCGASCVAGACQSACSPDGQSCSSGAQCCSGSCAGGFCQSGCLADDQNCTFPAQCCSGSCLGGSCASSCSSAGSTCSAGGECCSGQCEESRCCEDLGHACSLDAQCCSGACEEGACAASPECVPVGEQCLSSAGCCSGNCQTGFCQPSCFPDGQPCGAPAECCSGFCPAGSCQSGCFPDGQLCGAPAECCSLICAGGFCQPPCDLPGGTTSYPSFVPLPIPDNTPTAIASTIMVAGAEPYIHDLDLRTFLTHTFPGDLEISLTSPAGTSSTITTRNGGTSDNCFNGTLWDDQADPGNPVPFPNPTFPASNLVTDTTYSVGVPRPTLVPEEGMGAFIGEDPNGPWTLRVRDAAGLDTGTLHGWQLELRTLPSPPSETTTSFNNPVPQPIPSVGQPLVVSTILVAAVPAQISRVVLRTNIVHQGNGDLDITLTSPAGTVVTITSDNGGTLDNLFQSTVWSDRADLASPIPYSGNPLIVTDRTYFDFVNNPALTVEEALAAFQGENPNGVWTLMVHDDQANNGGALNGWSLDIVQTSCPAALTGPPGSPAPPGPPAPMAPAIRSRAVSSTPTAPIRAATARSAP